MRRSLGVCAISALLLVAVLLAAGTATAATVPTKSGDKAMVFMFSGLDDLGLTGYPGQYGIGVRYYFADHRAIRGGLTFGNYKYTCKAVVEGDEDLEDTDSGWGVDLAFEQHLEAPCAAVSPYVGAGFGYYSLKADTENLPEEEPPIPAGTTDSEERSGIRVGALAGFEWGFTDCLTLGGEYIVGWTSDSYKKERTTGDTTTTKEDTESSFTGFKTASLYLSVYW